ncbi:MAG: cyclase family protein [Candidatus Eisenbacteria bacterium]|uniref:Kynurenine formamidase n=1 Tax=Eiseniibacteriota bacterium TaxID=2212470 RepID=A0A948RUV8_UNCEI|nr:cyclase family protein [Candidatus Eisenbacteria bacterium]MBU1948496.1 cyclase family protein [Candidatus Eisenbacteria bacterium]MBU2689882.1 cyclase family protein [Candidatus Eisenbacteria bacterium]
MKENLKSDGWIDVSIPITTGMAHWPDRPPVYVEHVLDRRRGDDADVSRLSLGVHTGTHVDAPRNFFRGAAGIDRMPLDATIGRARVIPISDRQAVHVDELEMNEIQSGERILLKTRNSPQAWQSKNFFEDFVYISTAAAKWLADRGVRTVGIDYLSVGAYLVRNGEAVHRALLGAGVWIIEGLDLTRVPPGPCELICLPLKILGGDGAPARVVLRPI